MKGQERQPSWAAFALAAMASEQHENGEAYHEFLRVPALNAGIYHLAAGQPDPQKPHDEDEIYYVVAGKAAFAADGEEIEVGPGTVLYVKANIEHRFHSISEDLTLLVFFAGGSSGDRR